MTRIDRVDLAMQRVDRALRSWTSDVVIAGDLDLLQAELARLREEQWNGEHCSPTCVCRDESKDELIRLREDLFAARDALLTEGQERDRLREGIVVRDTQLAKLRESRSGYISRLADLTRKYGEHEAELARLRAYAKYADQAGEELGRLREENKGHLATIDGQQLELARLREKNLRLIRHLNRLLTKNARLRENAVMDERRLRYLSDERGRLREALTLIGGYHYSTREAKDLCDIANDALKEPQETD